jgi:hypothetical protein
MADIMSLIRILKDKDPNDPMNSLLRSRLSGQNMGSSTSGLQPGEVSPDIFNSRESLLSNFGGRNDSIRNLVNEQEAFTAQRKNQRLQDAEAKAMLKRMQALIPKPVKLPKPPKNPAPPPVVPIPAAPGSPGGGPSSYIPKPPPKPKDDVKVWLPDIKPETQKDKDKKKWDDYTRWACKKYGVCP